MCFRNVEMSLSVTSSKTFLTADLAGASCSDTSTIISLTSMESDSVTQGDLPLEGVDNKTGTGGRRRLSD